MSDLFLMLIAVFIKLSRDFWVNFENVTKKNKEKHIFGADLPA